MVPGWLRGPHLGGTCVAALPCACAGWLHAGPAANSPSTRLSATLSSNGAGPSRVVQAAKPVLSKEEALAFKETAFPSYLASEVDDFCLEWEDSLQAQERRIAHANGQTTRRSVTTVNPVWQTIRREAEADAKAEPLLSSFLWANILSHRSFERSLASVLSHRLADATWLATELLDIFTSVLADHEEVAQAALADCIAVRERDPACRAYSAALLYYKGYHAIQVQRMAHCLWNSDRKVMARALQARASEVFAVDIHPAARIGKGILLDHGIGVVIGETAVVGNNVSIMQNVTLGGTGKDTGDRHPKVGDNVLIGANATILGNIRVGKAAQVAAGSLVLKDVPPRTMVAGSPAREVGRISGNPAMKMQHWMKQLDKKADVDASWSPRPPSPAGATLVASEERASTSAQQAAAPPASGERAESHAEVSMVSDAQPIRKSDAGCADEGGPASRGMPESQAASWPDMAMEWASRLSATPSPAQAAPQPQQPPTPARASPGKLRSSAAPMSQPEAPPHSAPAGNGVRGQAQSAGAKSLSPAGSAAAPDSSTSSSATTSTSKNLQPHAGHIASSVHAQEKQQANGASNRRHLSGESGVVPGAVAAADWPSDASSDADDQAAPAAGSGQRPQASGAAGARGGGQPRERVEAVRTDEGAERRWPNSKDEPEYFI